MKKTPNHIAIILDGNGRWAEEKGKKRSFGHKAGFETLKKLSLHILKSEVSVLSVYAFSTENFKRSKEEVSFLMNLFIEKFTKEFDYYKKENIKVVFSGREKNLSKEVIAAMMKIEHETKDNDMGILNICLNYGSNYEIVDACNKIIKQNIDEVTIDDFSRYLYQDLPMIDLLIRTGREKRLSNFMLYQAAYAEIFFIDTLFPDFNEEVYENVLDDYLQRDRRFGGINYETKSN